MEISVTLVKELRERTSAGVMECKHALQEAEGNVDKAFEILRERGVVSAQKKADRVAHQGLIEAYIHPGGRLGAMVELNCETDFVAHTDEFKALAHDLTLQVAATDPQCVSPEELPPGCDAVPEEACLLLQPFVKDPTRKIRDLVVEVSAKTGEKVAIGRFVRFELSK